MRPSRNKPAYGYRGEEDVINGATALPKSKRLAEAHENRPNGGLTSSCDRVERAVSIRGSPVFMQGQWH